MRSHIGRADEGCDDCGEHATRATRMIMEMIVSFFIFESVLGFRPQRYRFLIKVPHFMGWQVVDNCIRAQKRVCK